MKLWSSGSTQKITSSFLILSLLTVAAVGGVAFWRAREALKQAAYQQLNVTATLKENQITRWLESCEEEFLLILEFPDVQAAIAELLYQPEATPETSQATEEGTAYGRLTTYFQSIGRVKPKFKEISILDRSNRIVLSTDKSREGEYEIATNLTYFEEVVAGEDFTPVFYVSPKTGKPAVTYAAPIRDQTGKRQGVLLVDLDLREIDQIVREQAGLGISGETYLVGSLAEKTAFISRQELAINLPESPESEGITQAMQGVNAQHLYNNYAGVPVIGVYRWLQAQDIALLVEMSQAEAFAPARRLAGTIVAVGLGAAAILVLGVARLARQLSVSRVKLENYSRRIEQKAQEALEANRAKSEFLANMSHELRTPLNAILGFTQLMARDPRLGTTQLDRLNIIGRSGEHLLALINDVLSMSKIEAGRTTLNETRFDLHQLLASLEEMLLVKAADRGLPLSFKRTPDIPQFIEADEGKLRQVLLNLLGNAIKFTERGHVSLTVDLATCSQRLSEREHTPLDETDRGTLYNLKFEIVDTGPGIDTPELEKLFDPFFQASKSRQAHQGTGLGLAISDRFVTLMGGQLDVDSEVGVGSTFRFNILAKPTQALTTSRLTQRARVIGLTPAQPQYRILIVEDADDSRLLLAELLKTVGFTIHTAANGQEAFDQWKSWQPHLIWMDMRMPVMDGYEATRRIRATTSSAHRPIIIALTASAFEEDRAAVLASGCDDFVRKPFQEHIIFEKMALYLGVQYRYETLAPAANDVTENGHDSDHELTQTVIHAVKKMPQPWICRFHRAAVQVDAERIKALILQMPGKEQTAANQLTKLTDQFDFDTLIELTETLL